MSKEAKPLRAAVIGLHMGRSHARAMHGLDAYQLVALCDLNAELAQALVEQGYLSYDDLSVIEPDVLMEMGGLTAEQVERIVEQADQRAEEAEEAAAAERRRQRESRQGEDEPAAGAPSPRPTRGR